MNRADQDAAEFFDAEDDYLADDLIPDSLIAVMKIIAEDLVPETRAVAEVINHWLAENVPAPGTWSMSIASSGQLRYGAVRSSRSVAEQYLRHL